MRARHLKIEIKVEGDRLFVSVSHTFHEACNAACDCFCSGERSCHRTGIVNTYRVEQKKGS